MRLLFTHKVHCTDCFAKFRLNRIGKAVLSILVALVPTASILGGLYFSSWIVFAGILIILPLTAGSLLACFSELELIGVRGRWRQQRDKQETQT